ncbi:hypothetical protein AURDEDRAFT_116903 [Auricularia subglabra TFB-10046 SS5]|uniref:Uncharacterized protein n=1 Tax=Auricularia subglabra (strain TFB-10046 / SS5) TaxID=717982 RepID=J0WU47_AURST|nr:hypothetical protein AURDEDRAFT_116903 [Auricularia subglabra TFB-10046 SS5]
MLREGSRVPGNDGFRENYLLASCLKGLLHPQLARFERLLKLMTTYFSIPWDKYKEKYRLGRTHAHDAMRRLLLLTLVQTCEELDIELDTAQPRRCDVFSQETIAKSLPASTLANTGDATSGTGDAPQQNLAPAVAAVKRPRPDDDIDDDGEGGDDGDGDGHDDGDGREAHGTQPASKRPSKRHNTGQPVDAKSDSADAAFTDHYTEEEHLKQRSANSLLLKVWKDRHLWFGSGY